MATESVGELEVLAMPRGLGSLESRLMGVLWGTSQEPSVQDICTLLGSQDNYKTVMTVLNRLVEKGLLSRRLKGRAYQYYPRLSREEFLKSMARDTIRSFSETYGDDGMVHLVRALTARFGVNQASKIAVLVTQFASLIVGGTAVRVFLSYFGYQRKA